MASSALIQDTFIGRKAYVKGTIENTVISGYLLQVVKNKKFERTDKYRR